MRDDGHVLGDRGHGHVLSDRGHGNVLSDRGHGNVLSDRGHGNVLSDEVAVQVFWAYYRRCGRPPRSAIARLTELALSPEPEEAVRGSRLLFGQVVEPLCDAFTLQAAEAYRCAFAYVISAARCKPECRGLHLALAARGIHTERDLLRRTTCGAAFSSARRARVRCVTVLSRLTLGADVAVCLPMLTRAARLFPNAEIRFVGGEGARIVAAGAQGVPSVRHVNADYGRNDRLVDRLNAWLGVCAAVAGAGTMPVAGAGTMPVAGAGTTSPSESLVLDPDSRLTQLGLLPPTASSDYYHFPSRTRGDGEPATLGELAVDWLDETFDAEDGGGHAPPVLELIPRDASWSRALRAAVSASPSDGVSRIVAVSLGVGGNDRKRIGTTFETDLLAWIAARGWRVLLARGTGAAEVACSLDLGERLAARGLRVLHLERGRHLPNAGRHASTGRERAPQIVTWEADVGAFLAAIACADIYVGYDSAGQHLAAALGVPTLSIFVEAAGRRHALRWTPRGRAALRVVRSPYPPNERAVLERAKAEFVRLADHSDATAHAVVGARFTA